MPLFDNDAPSIGTRAKAYAEPLFDYYNRSARTDVAAVKQLLERWYERFPVSAAAEVRQRFRSPSSRQHQSAFFELYLNELMTRVGYTVEAHPHVDEPTHPDFLLNRDGEPQLYLEATIAAESDKEAGQQKLVDQAYDTLDRIQTPDFLLGLRVQGAPQTAPPGRRLKDKLERWLATLDWAAARQEWEQNGFDGLPSFGWEHDGWSLLIQAIPKSQEHRGSADVRPIGLSMPVGVFPVTVDEDIKRAVQVKNKYGVLDLPFVVAINVTGDFCSRYDVANALFGHETVVFGPNGTRPGQRMHDGAWDAPKGPQNTTISAVLVFRHLNVWNLADVDPWFIHNPWARTPLPTDKLPFPQFVPNNQTGEMTETEGIKPSSLLDLPDPWPPQEAE